MKCFFRTAAYPLVILGITLSACIYYWLNLHTSQQAELQSARRRSELHVQQINEAVVQQIDASLLSIDTALKQLRSVYLHNPGDFDRSARDLLKAYPKGMLQAVSLIKTDGSLAYTSENEVSSSHLSFADREYFSIHADSDMDRLFISKPIIERPSGIPLIQITRTIRAGNHFVGVIGITLRPDYISNNLWSLHIDPNDMISILSEDGQIIARSRKLEEKLTITPPFMRSKPGEHGIFRDVSVSDKVPLLFSWGHLVNYPIIAVAAIDEAKELQNISELQSDTSKHTIQAMALVIAFALWISLLIIKLKQKHLELVRSQETLQNNETRLRIMLNNEMIGIVTVKDRIIQWANPALEKMLGYQHGELTGIPTRQNFLNEQAYQSFGESAYATLRSGKIFRSEIEHRLKNGTLIWVDVSGTLLNPETGESLWAFIDINDRYRAEMKLSESETRLRTIIDNEPECIKIVDAEGLLIQMNPAGLKMIEADSFEQVAGWPVVSVVAAEYRDAFTAMHHRVIAGEAVQMEFEVQGLKGGRRWLETHAVPLQDQGVTVHLAVTRDISERKRLEAASAEALDRLQKIASQVPGVVYQYRLSPDGSSCFPFASEGLQAIYRISPELAMSDANLVFAHVHPDDHDGIIASIQESARELTPWFHEYRVKFEDGTVDWLLSNAIPQREIDGSVLWHGFTTKINDRKLYETELKRSNAELEQFSYAVSHDMRQPLRMISSYLQLLERSLADQLDGEKREFFNYAIDGAKRIDQMLVALLEYSRVGRKCNSPDWIASRTMLDEALRFLSPAIKDAQAALSISGDWPNIMASRDEITRLLQNLIGNAVKYRIVGRIPQITICSELLNQEWKFSVSDNGVGIDPEQIRRLFKVFQRLHTRVAYEGTGVGLALCRKIVEHHDGRIWAESAGVGLGSKFMVVLPCMISREPVMQKTED